MTRNEDGDNVTKGAISKKRSADSEGEGSASTSSSQQQQGVKKHKKHVMIKQWMSTSLQETREMHQEIKALLQNIVNASKEQADLLRAINASLLQLVQARQPTTIDHDIAREEARHRRETHRQWWEMKDRRTLWILTGAPPLSLDATTLQNMLDNVVNVTKDVFAMLSSMSGFNVLAFAPRGANPRDTTPIDTRLSILCRSVVLLLSKCLPHDPIERQRCSDRIGVLDTAFERGLNRLRYAASRCTRAVASPTVAAVIRTHINRDVGDWVAAVQTLSVHMEHARCGCPPASAAEIPPIPVPTWFGLITFLDSGMLDIEQQQLLIAPSGSPGRANRMKSRSQVCLRFLEGNCQRQRCRFLHPDLSTSTAPRAHATASSPPPAIK